MYIAFTNSRIESTDLGTMKFLGFYLALLLAWYDISLTSAEYPVAGTGWTDVSQLQSNCGSPGYFVNPSDCSRFYVCVDHSTPEHRLLLRYDFDCPGGLAFDEGNKICNYPGPSGCIAPGGGGGGGWGWGWSKGSKGPWQSTATVTKPNSWGSSHRGPSLGPSKTIIRVPSGGHGGGGGIIRVQSTQAPHPSNPRINVQQTGLRLPHGHWESLRINRPVADPGFGVKVHDLPSGGWAGRTRIVAVNPGVFQSAKVGEHVHSVNSDVFQSAKVGEHVHSVNSGVFQSAKVTEHARGEAGWGTSKPYPANPGVFQSVQVTPAPPAEWGTPQPFPQVPQSNIFQNVREGGAGGWGGGRINVTPSPIPAHPAHAGFGFGVGPSPSPAPWQGARISGVPSQVLWNSPQPSNPAVNLPAAGYPFAAQGPPHRFPAPSNPVRDDQIGFPAPANPALEYQYGLQATSNHAVTGQYAGNPSASNPQFNFPAGSPGADVRYTQIPSGYVWQSNTLGGGGGEPQQQQFTVSSQSQASQGQQLQQQQQGGAAVNSGDFGIVQQVISEQAQGQSGEAGKSHIQRIYDNKEKQESANQPESEEAAGAVNQPQPSNPVGPTANLKGPIYEIINSSDPSVKGRIIVLYAPFSRGGKRDAPPRVEVQVVDEDDEGNQNAKK